MKDLNPTTRRYPNTLRDAFPQDYYDWFEAPPKKNYNWALALLGIAMWVLIAALLAWK